MNQEAIILGLAVSFVALALVLLAVCIRQHKFERRTKEALKYLGRRIGKLGGDTARESKRV
ncbi:MAG: hypothetical protein KID04_04340 [Clostridium sp.]|nr:hypothetical protein [Clostridium sp.]